MSDTTAWEAFTTVLQTATLDVAPGEQLPPRQSWVSQEVAALVKRGPNGEAHHIGNHRAAGFAEHFNGVLQCQSAAWAAWAAWPALAKQAEGLPFLKQGDLPTQPSSCRGIQIVSMLRMIKALTLSIELRGK
ncbi:hypothetical protein N2152v2_007054 [Parachlorella kessleri]